jgi:hypothetical protein
MSDVRRETLKMLIAYLESNGCSFGVHGREAAAAIRALIEPAKAPKLETARQLYERLGWPPLTETQERANLKYNLAALGVTRAKPASVESPGVPLSPETTDLLRRGLADAAAGRVSPVPDEVFAPEVPELCDEHGREDCDRPDHAQPSLRELQRDDRMSTNVPNDQLTKRWPPLCTCAALPHAVGCFYAGGTR